MAPIVDGESALRTASGLIEAAKMLARSFDDDPLFRFLLPDDRLRARWLVWFHRTALGEAAIAGQTRVASDPSRGAIGFFRPGAYPPPLGASLRSLSVPRVLPTLRLLRSGLAAEWQTRRAHPPFPHLYVRVLGVDPSEKGRGLGGALLGAALDEAKALSVPLYLETSNPVNLGFYRRYGLEVRDEFTVHGSPPIWTMA